MAHADFTFPTELRPLFSALVGIPALQGVEAYVCGGFVRDALLGLVTRDIDIAVGGDPLAIGPAVAEAMGGTYFAMDTGRRHVRILLRDGVQVDLTPLRGSIEEDLRKRDYTVDALASRLDARGDPGPVIDPTGGLTDLETLTVRAVSEQALLDDPLRLLRGARIATVLGLKVEEDTAALIRKHAAHCAEAAEERQRDELVRIFGTDRVADGLRLMDNLGLLSVVMPEIGVTRGVEQPKNHHYYDVFEHGMATVSALDIIMDRSERGDDVLGLRGELHGAIEWWPQARDYFDEEMPSGGKRSALLKLCGFLHDVGKPEMKTVDENGRIRFYGHSEAGAEIAARLMKRLRYPSREVGIVKAMIAAHLRPLQMAEQGAPSRRAVYKFFRDTREAGIDTLFLSLADHAGSQGPLLRMEGWRRHLAVVAYIVAVRFEKPEQISPPKLIAGEDLMEEFGLSPGPLLGELLSAVREAQGAGEISTREEALAVARARLEQTDAGTRS